MPRIPHADPSSPAYPVFLDWDCTLTRRHMFSFLQGLKNSESVEFQSTFLDRGAGASAFKQFVARNAVHYRSWGRKDATSLEAVKTLTLQRVGLFSSDDGDEVKLLKEPLRSFLFGSAERQEQLTQTLKHLHDESRAPLVILTKGIASYVIAAIEAFFPHWFELLPGLLVVDYSGHIFLPTAAASSHIGSTCVCSPKLPQMFGVFEALGLPQPPALALVDDGFEGELSHLPSHHVSSSCTRASGSGSGSGHALALSGGPAALLTVTVPFGADWSAPASQGQQLQGQGQGSVAVCLLGPPRNMDGLNARDLAALRSALVPLLRSLSP
jgi:hypothetical protein